MKSVQTEEYNIVPRTWILPSEYISLSNYMKDLKRKRKNKTFIIKPPNSSMGNGSVRYLALSTVWTIGNYIVI